MDDLIADCWSTNRPALGIVHDEAAISAGNVRLREDISPQGKKVRFEMALELSNILAAPLTAAKQKPSSPDILWRR